MTATEIINETVEYYRKNPRSLDQSGKCVYQSPEGNMCAVGRCLDWDKYKENIINANQDGLIDLIYECKVLPSGRSIDNNESVLDPILAERYRGFSLEFWSDLQVLHDTASYWEDTSLSKGGEVYLQDIIQKAINGKYEPKDIK